MLHIRNNLYPIKSLMLHNKLLLHVQYISILFQRENCNAHIILYGGGKKK